MNHSQNVDSKHMARHLTCSHEALFNRKNDLLQSAMPWLFLQPPTPAAGNGTTVCPQTQKLCCWRVPTRDCHTGQSLPTKCNGPTSPWSTRLLDRESPPSQVSLTSNHKLVIISACSPFPTGYSQRKLLLLFASLFTPTFTYSSVSFFFSPFSPSHIVPLNDTSQMRKVVLTRTHAYVISSIFHKYFCEIFT